MRNQILAICGSTRKDSVNHHLIEAITRLCENEFLFSVYTSIGDIAAFNPDIPEEEQPATVKAFRKLVKDADGILICTPEYAHGVPGALKNAFDWTVGSAEFSGKPTALITASTDGSFSHAAFLEILRTIDCKNVGDHELLIQFIKTKINAAKEIIHEPTKKAIMLLMDALGTTIKNNN